MLTSYQKLLILRACEYRASKAIENGAVFGETQNKLCNRAKIAVDFEVKTLAENMHVDEAEIRSVLNTA